MRQKIETNRSSIQDLIRATGILLLLFCTNNLFSQETPNQLIQQISETTDSEKKLDLLLQLSDNYFYENSDSAFLYSFLANDIVNSKNFKNDSLKARSELSLGDLYATIQDTINSFRHLDNAIQLAKQEQLTTILAACYGTKGLIYGDLGIYDQAMIFYEKSRTTYSQLNDPKGISIANNNIGTMYLDLKAFDKAIDYFQENYQFEKQDGDMHGQAIALFNLGAAMEGKHEYDEALNYFLKCKTIADSLGFKYSAMLISGSLGRIYDKKDMPELSFDYSQRSYSLASELGQKPDMAMSAIYLAKSLNKQNDYQQAIEFGKEALTYLNDISSKEDHTKIYKTLADSYYGVGDFKKSSSFYKKYEAERDTLMDQDRAKIFAEIDIQYKVAEKEKENKTLKLAQKENQVIIEQRTLIAISIGMGMLLLSLLTASLYLRNKRRRENSIQLEHKVKERTEHLKLANLRLQKANEELERFTYITSHDLKEPLRNISRFAGLIENRLDQNNIEELKDHLQFVVSNAKQMNDLLNDILTFSKIGKTPGDHKMVSFLTMINDIKKELQSIIKEKHAQIVFDQNISQEDLSTINLPSILSIVFNNLIQNGIKYNQRLEPQVKIDYKQTSSNLIITISDNGIGIAEKYHQQVFQLFKRLHNRSEYTGSGIGLAICKKIIEGLGGVIQLDSKENQGTSFKIELPISVLAENKNHLNSIPLN